VLDRRARRLLPPAVAAPANPLAPPLPPASEIGWLEPYPDALLNSPTVDEQIVARETIELAFLVAIQHLPPRQRAVLILRDVLGWSAREAAEVVGTTVIATNSALQRARTTLREHLPERRLDWRRASMPDDAERHLLERYMDAWNRTDVDALVALLARDARSPCRRAPAGTPDATGSERSSPAIRWLRGPRDTFMCRRAPIGSPRSWSIWPTVITVRCGRSRSRCCALSTA